MTDTYVKLAADYSSSGLWHREGWMMFPSDLPVTPELLARIKAWNDDYDQNCPYDDRPSNWDAFRHATTGWNIARSIKHELPKWTVMFFDEPTLEMYEI